MWALRFEDVTKTYPAGSRGYRSLRAELRTLGRGRRRPTAAPGGADTRRDRLGHDGEPDEGPDAQAAPALDRVSFDVAEGESVAVIGPNGAGKSTALRIAARVTAPTTGRVRRRGRVGALIEVGAGIHPELTGRENIWLYGAILGLSRRELASRFDAIVAFAEVERALDQQVKRYSSGMQLRLGFAIAAGIEPDVLVVDEALAVGDARFQVRCLERMAELVRSGTTLLYVSHDLATVQATCSRGVLLIEGRVAHDGPAGDAINAYLDWVAGIDDVAVGEGPTGGDTVPGVGGGAAYASVADAGTARSGGADGGAARGAEADGGRAGQGGSAGGEDPAQGGRAAPDDGVRGRGDPAGHASSGAGRPPVGRDARRGSAAVGCVVDATGRRRPAFRPGDEVVVRVPLPAGAGRSGPVSVALGIRDGHAWNVVGSVGVVAVGRDEPGPAGCDAVAPGAEDPEAVGPGAGEPGSVGPGAVAQCRIRSLPLGAGVYQVWASVDGDGLDGAWRHLGGFRVEDPGAAPRPLWLPPVVFDHDWTTEPGP